MKKALEVIFVVANFIVLLPAMFCCVFAKTAVEERLGDKALVAATYILSLLNCAALWWLIYKVFIG